MEELEKWLSGSELAALLETQVQFPAPTWQSTTVHDSSSMCVLCLNACLFTTRVSLVPVETEESRVPGTGAIHAMSHHVGAGNWPGLWRTRALHYSLVSPAAKKENLFFSVFLFTFFIFKLFYSFYTRPQFPLPYLLPTFSPSHPTIHSSENVRPYVPQLNKRIKKMWHISTMEYHSVVTSWNLQADRWN